MTPMAPPKTYRRCDIAGCDGEHVARGLCGRHYHRWERHGDPLAGGIHRIADPDERFWSKVDIPSRFSCWWYEGSCTPIGHGLFRSGGKTIQAHRFSYERLVGPIPDGLVIDHLCRNPPCVNPAHLEPVTQRVNVQRGDAAKVQRGRGEARTHCLNGHEWTEENTYRPPSGGRMCRSCMRTNDRKSKARKRAKRLASVT